MKYLLLSTLGAAVLLLSVTASSADVVCNDAGDCWHTRGRVEYKPDLKLRIHPDDWKWREADHYRWREHEGRGYWRGGVWVDL
jgi:hypothetical protein